MTIESATYIDDLNASYPAATDEKQEGDDHIRLIKAVIKATFPNISGAVTPTHTELNYVDGVTSAIQDQIDALVGGMTSIDSGTVMLFVQTAAPTGWTKSTTHNNKALRIVSGTASSGGSVAFSTLFGRTATDSFTLTSAHIPSHTHSFSASLASGTAASNGSHQHSGEASGSFVQGGALAESANLASGSSYYLGATNYAGAHTHTVTGTVSGTTGGYGSSGGHTHAVDMRVQYVDAILAVKD